MIQSVLPWIAVPIMAGTGSEVTFSSVITDTEGKHKMTVMNPFMAAKVVLVDPELTYTVPLRTAAATGVDALTHAIEAYTVTCSEPISDAAALHAIVSPVWYRVESLRTSLQIAGKSVLQ